MPPDAVNAVRAFPAGVSCRTRKPMPFLNLCREIAVVLGCQRLMTAILATELWLPSEE